MTPINPSRDLYGFEASEDDFRRCGAVQQLRAARAAWRAWRCDVEAHTAGDGGRRTEQRERTWPFSRVQCWRRRNRIGRVEESAQDLHHHQTTGELDHPRAPEILGSSGAVRARVDARNARKKRTMCWEVDEEAICGATRHRKTRKRTEEIREGKMHVNLPIACVCGAFAYESSGVDSIGHELTETNRLLPSDTIETGRKSKRM